MKEYLNFAVKIANYAGNVMREYFFEKDNPVEFKEDKTPVTYADKLINNYLINEVKKVYPTHSVDGEEAKYLNNSEYVWVCDPIDGTSMYTRHIPVAVFSLALVIDGVPSVAVVYDPFLDEMYTAIKGEGAYCNNKKIYVNKTKLGQIDCTIDYCSWDDAKYDTLKIVKELRNEAKICQIGSVAHACMLVASGRICAELFPGTTHGHCDMAASKLIVEEAGGKVTNFNGEEQRYDREIGGAVITNMVIHDEIMEKIKNNI